MFGHSRVRFSLSGPTTDSGRIRSACGVDKALIQGFEVDARYLRRTNMGKLPISAAGERTILFYSASQSARRRVLVGDYSPGPG